MKFSALKKYLTQNPSESIYLIEGEDAYFRERALKLITEHTVTEYFELNVTVLTAPTAKQIADNLSVFPFMSEKRVVIIKEYYPSVQEVAALARGFEHNETGVLIISNAEKSASLKKLENVCRIDCGKEETDILLVWINALFKARGMRIRSDAAQKLVAYCANDMMKIANEIEKLAVVKDEIVSEADIEKNVAKDVEYQTYMFTNAVTGKARNVYEIMGEFLNKGEVSSCLILLSSLYTAYRRMLYCQDSTMSKEELSRILGIKPYAVTMTARAAKGFKREELIYAMDMLSKSEYAVKSGNRSGENALFYAVAALLK